MQLGEEGSGEEGEALLLPAVARDGGMSRKA